MSPRVLQNDRYSLGDAEHNDSNLLMDNYGTKLRLIPGQQSTSVLKITVYIGVSIPVRPHKLYSRF